MTNSHLPVADRWRIVETNGIEYRERAGETLPTLVSWWHTTTEQKNLISYIPERGQFQINAKAEKNLKIHKQTKNFRLLRCASSLITMAHKREQPENALRTSIIFWNWGGSSKGLISEDIFQETQDQGENIKY